MPGIFVLDANRKLHELHEQPYETEALLQQLLTDFPNLLAGDLVDAEAPRRWLLISPELGLADADDASNRWAVDHLFVDQDGIPTIVEVKRSTDTRIRREVIGQVLEYAANAVSYWPIEKLQATFEGRCQAQGTDASQTLQEFIGESGDPSAFWGTINTNLKAGKIRILLVGDSIPSEVRRIVEFLNGQMVSAEILAVEIKQFGNETLKTLVPRVYGQTEQATGVKAPGRGRTSKQWDEASTFDDAQTRIGTSELGLMRRLLTWSQQAGLDLRWGSGAVYGSFTSVVRSSAGVPMSLFSVYGTGHLEVLFVRWSLPPFSDPAARRECLARLRHLPGFDLPDTWAERRPNVRLADIATEANLARVLDVFGWVLAELRRVERESAPVS
jgi:hypothetical protein